MNHTQLLRAILPDVLIDNFDVVKFEKTDTRFDIWLDEKKVQMREDKKNSSVISTLNDYEINQPVGTWGYLGISNIWDFHRN